MHNRARMLAAAAAFLLCALAHLSPSASAQQKAKSLDELALEADVVAVGRVTGLKSEWDARKTRIYTRVTLSVDEYVKEGGERATSVTILTPGGEVDDVGEVYTHVPTFKQNEEVVVFLRAADSGTYRVASGTQGKFLVEVDPASGGKVVAGKYPVNEFTTTVRNASLK